MDINLQLKKRRELIEKQKSYQRTKIIRQYKQQVANDNNIINNDLKDTNDKFTEFQKREEKRLNDEKKLLGDDLDESDNEIKNKPKINKEKEKNKENEKLAEFKEREEKRLKDEKKLLGENLSESDNEIKKEERQKIKKEKKEEKKEKQKDKFIGNKRTREEIEAERQKKINKRRKNYRNLHRTNKFGQPLMKYQIQNIFDKIKKKKKEGII